MVWTNQDGAPHSATARDGSFDSSVLTRGQTFQLRPTEAGTFEYFCTVHPNDSRMRGTLRVTP